MKHIAVRLVFLLLLLSVALFHVKAQFVDYGTDPARFKWNYVRTPHYKVIYPRGNDSTAYRYVSFLENVYPYMGKTIGTPKKAVFPVILHPGNMQSNGMVAWAPRRMELVTTPSSNLYAQAWDRQLVVHESRHVFQTGRLIRGIFNPLYYIAGEQITGVVDLGVPKWFFEGDAVVAETAMSNSGRGRLPEFNMYYRAQMLSGDFFSFDKWAMGSYKDYTGNYYALGYDMVSYARQQYGADVWDKVLDRYAKRIYTVPPFTNALKHYTGLTTGQLFNKTFDYLKEEWIQQDQLREPDRLNRLSPEKKRYTSYKSPLAYGWNSVLAIRSGPDDINALVLLENGKEEVWAYIGTPTSRLVAGHDRIYWTEYRSGLRWTHENYSDLKYYDPVKGRVGTVTSGQRYLAPAIHPEEKIAAVSRYTIEGKNEIVLLDVESGEKKRVFPAPPDAFIKELTFAGPDALIGISVEDSGIRLLKLTIKDGKWNEVLGYTFANITSPVWHEGQLYFESGLDGINNIYTLNTETGEVYRLTSARFGVFQPEFSLNGKELLVSDYQASGFQVASVPMDQLKREKADFHSPYQFSLAETMAEQEGFNLDTARLEPVPFQPKPYRKGLNLFSIHSWAPFYYDAMDAVNFNMDDFSTIVKPGAMILSQDPLNTMIMQAGWYYRNGDHHGKLSLVYMGWYPVIDVTVDYGGRTFDRTWVKGSQDQDSLALVYPDRNHVKLEGRIYVPFNFSRNDYVRGFQPSMTYYYTNNRYQRLSDGTFGHFQYLLSELRYYHYRRMAQRDIFPRWGYQVRLQHLFTPFNTENYGSLYAARLTTYWPGLVRNDGLMLRAGYQYQSIDDKYMYIGKQLLDEPRGYGYNYRTRQMFTFKADYSFNLFSPDFSIGSLAYIKRVRANLFFDLASNQTNKEADWETIKSFGGDLIFDWNALRLNYPLSLGVRIADPVDYGNIQVEALFSINF